jgi:hypothetical protein
LAHYGHNNIQGPFTATNRKATAKMKKMIYTYRRIDNSVVKLQIEQMSFMYSISEGHRLIGVIAKKGKVWKQVGGWAIMDLRIDEIGKSIDEHHNKHAQKL